MNIMKNVTPNKVLKMNKYCAIFVLTMFPMFDIFDLMNPINRRKPKYAYAKSSFKNVKPYEQLKRKFHPKG